MSRHVDWKARLVEYLARSAACPFVYGRFDCMLFALGGVAVMTGVDLAEPYRARYATQKQGIALLRRDGWRDHVALVAAHFAEVAPAFAQAGDLAVLPGDDGPALGLVQGERVYVLARLPSPAAQIGLTPLLAASRAFRVA